MWLHPITAKQIRVLAEDWGVVEAADGTIESGWFEVLRPQEKSLACGDVGDGAMKEWTEVVRIIEARLGLGSGQQS
jgi:phosphopantothenoylcysteine decarboxylase